jgi:hypothetical protein
MTIHPSRVMVVTARLRMVKSMWGTLRHAVAAGAPVLFVSIAFKMPW